MKRKAKGTKEEKKKKTISWEKTKKTERRKIGRKKKIPILQYKESKSTVLLRLLSLFFSLLLFQIPFPPPNYYSRARSPNYYNKNHRTKNANINIVPTSPYYSNNYLIGVFSNDF